MTKEEVLKTIEKVVAIVSKKYTFAYFTLEDIQQEARLLALKVLPKYDGVRRLDNFLYIHLNNRLTNLLRDTTHHIHPPCLPCHQNKYDLCEYKQMNEGPCERYLIWQKKNRIKHNIVNPHGIEKVDKSVNAKVGESFAYEELKNKIDEALPINLRQPYLKMLAGIKVSKPQREAVQKAVLDILQKKGVAGGI